ncbi:MAG TPA: primosomal protein N' [Terriglobia bacterium]|nr:primosomal protein N' [Terriglobia bacterium]
MAKKSSRAQGTLIDVAVMSAIRHPLTYRVPASLEVWPGQRVRVPLGARQANGMALEPVLQTEPGVKPRDILRVIDSEPVLSPQLLTLGLWIAEYYLAPPGEVFRAMLPLQAETRKVRLLELTEAGRKRFEEIAGNLLGEVRESPEGRLLAYLAQHPGVGLGTVEGKFRGEAPDLLTRALQEGWVEEKQAERGRKKVLAASLAVAKQENDNSPPRRKLSPVALRIIEALKSQGSFEDHRELLRASRAAPATLSRLVKAGVVELRPSDDFSRRRSKTAAIPDADSAPSVQEFASATIPDLTPAQSQAVDDLSNLLDRNQFAVALLHGVTGSGKTEVYMRFISHCLDRGRTALMLIPEIALTPLVQGQFQARFPGNVAILHSGLTAVERDREWRRARRGAAKVIVGTRSALFAPVSDLGAIIVDEEHDSSYKQQETPRYQGRDAAVVRGRLAKALVVLGSATPSLESYWNAQQGKYKLLTLAERISGRPMASVEIVDMRQEFRETHSQFPLSRRLREEIEAQRRSGAQTMILLNRRGYSWFLLCRSCGQSIRCVNCSISLTYHQREHRLICHYCGYSTEVPKYCPACKSEHLQYVGEGTEKIEDRLRETFPGARVARLDRDVARRSGQYLRLLSDFRRGKIDILVGTQMIAKGHDFPGVTLVGVVSADMGLSLPDFRAAERTFQLLTQAAGRSGRGEAPGRVLVQTFFPEHYAIRFAAEQNYSEFFNKELKFRRVMRYPPITALANVIAQDGKLEKAASIAAEIANFLKRGAGGTNLFKVLGPNPAPLARIEGRYRIQFLIKSTSRSQLNGLLRNLADDCERKGITPRSCVIDMDPFNMM